MGLLNGKLIMGDAIIARNAELLIQAKKHEVIVLPPDKNMKGGVITKAGITKLENAGFRVSKGGKK